VSALRRAAYTDTHPFVLDIMTIIPRIDSVPSNAPQSRCNYTSLTTTPATQISGNSYIVTLSFLDSSLKHYQSYYSISRPKAGCLFVKRQKYVISEKPRWEYTWHQYIF
jgi:hypothetical protein